MAGYERVAIDGDRFYVCAELDCRRPLERGHNPCYYIPQPGRPSQRPDEAVKQTVCGPCYIKEYKIVNPNAPVPLLFDGYAEGHNKPVPVGAKESLPGVDYSLLTDIELWEEALMASRRSGGAETVQQAYSRITGSGLETTVHSGDTVGFEKNDKIPAGTLGRGA